MATNRGLPTPDSSPLEAPSESAKLLCHTGRAVLSVSALTSDSDSSERGKDVPVEKTSSRVAVSAKLAAAANDAIVNLADLGICYPLLITCPHRVTLRTVDIVIGFVSVYGAKCGFLARTGREGSIRGKLKRAGWNNSYLSTILIRFTQIQMI